MSKLIETTRFGLASLVLASILVSGIVHSSETPPAATADEVKAKAEARWKALIDGDYGAAYEYASPGFRLKVSKSTYVSRFVGKVTYEKADVDGVKCDGEACTLKVKAAFTVVPPPPFPDVLHRTGAFNESWVRLENNWWFVPDR